jgi:hypothetical protein
MYIRVTPYSKFTRAVVLYEVLVRSVIGVEHPDDHV